MPDYTIFDLEVGVLTPLHIGSGSTLLLDYDYAVHGTHTWRLNEDAILDMQVVDDPALADALAQSAPVQMLEQKDYVEDGPLFHYVLKGMPRSRQAGARLVEQIKNHTHQPYLPGSSLKGAVRTALASHGFRAGNVKLERSKLGRNSRWAAQRIEQEIFGADPNHDLLRALHVRDSDPLPPSCMMLLNARVVTRQSSGTPIELEAIKPDTVFRTTVKIDEALFSDWAKSLGFRGKEAWLDDMPAIIQKFSVERMQYEAGWYAQVSGAEQIARFYQDMLTAPIGGSACLLQLGWGCGWGSKTLSGPLREDEQFLEGVIGEYRMARGRGRRQVGDPFPRSRTLVSNVIGRQGVTEERFVFPLGWVILNFKERG